MYLQCKLKQAAPLHEPTKDIQETHGKTWILGIYKLHCKSKQNGKTQEKDMKRGNEVKDKGRLTQLRRRQHLH